MTTAQPTTNVPGPEPKNAKKKKAKTESVSQPRLEVDHNGVGPRRGSVDEAVNGADGSQESPYIRELQK